MGPSDAPSDPFQRWSHAPKHWMRIPAQRQGPPRVVTPARRAAGQGGAVAALVALTAALVLTMLAPAVSVADRDDLGTAPERIAVSPR